MVEVCPIKLAQTVSSKSLWLLFHAAVWENSSGIGKNNRMSYLEITSVSSSLSLSVSLSVFASHTQTSTKTSGPPLQNHWSEVKKKRAAVFPLYDLLTSKWEHKKALCHWENGRVMGQWLTCCLGPRDCWGTRGLPQCLYPQNCYTIYGLSWVCMCLWFTALHLVLWGHCCWYFRAWSHGVLWRWSLSAGMVMGWIIGTGVWLKGIS